MGVYIAREVQNTQHNCLFSESSVYTFHGYVDVLPKIFNVTGHHYGELFWFIFYDDRTGTIAPVPPPDIPSLPSTTPLLSTTTEQELTTTKEFTSTTETTEEAESSTIETKVSASPPETTTDSKSLFNPIHKQTIIAIVAAVLCITAVFGAAAVIIGLT